MAAPVGGNILGTLVVIAGTIATCFVFVLAARATLWPGETAPDHPKRLVLKDDR